MEKAPMTLDDFAIIQSCVTRFRACKVAEDIIKKSWLEDALLMGYRPPTKWQRRKMRVKEFFGRFHLAWRALRGDDLSFED